MIFYVLGFSVLAVLWYGGYRYYLGKKAEEETSGTATASGGGGRVPVNK